MTRFNSEEVLQMAQQIERNGQRFYTRAAEIVSDESAIQILNELAIWEERHEAIFAAMRETVNLQKVEEQTWMDSDGEAERYLLSLADSKVFMQDVPVEELIPPDSGVDQIFKLALANEKESIVFYSALRKAVPPALGAEKVDAIIEEELKHVRILNRERERAADRPATGRYDKLATPEN